MADDDDAVPLVERDPTPPLGLRAIPRPPLRTSGRAGIVVAVVLLIGVAVALTIVVTALRSIRGR
jgi:hypothetical protein